MRLVTFSRNSAQRLGLMGPQEHIIDLAEVNRRYLKGGNAPFMKNMQSFIEAGGKAVQIARKAEKYVAGKNADEQKKLLSVGALVKPNQAKIISPIPLPKKNCVMLGINYREHVDEGARARELEIKYPEWPVFFTNPRHRSSAIWAKSSTINARRSSTGRSSSPWSWVGKGATFRKTKLTTTYSVTPYAWT